MAIKTTEQEIEERIKQKELDNFEGNLDVEKIRAITDLLNAAVPTESTTGDNIWSSPFNKKGMDIITAKAIELVKRI